MAAPENYAVYYPEEPEVGTPTYSFAPTKCLMIGGTQNGRDRGLLQQQTADGERTSYIVHPVKRRFVRPLFAVPYAEMILHDSFFDSTRGLSLRYTDRFLYPTYVTVKAIGESVDGEWTPTTPTTWARIDEFEESQAVPTLSDAGQVRAGYIEIEDLNVEGTVLFDTPFADDGYYPVITSCVASNGDTFKADVILPWRDDGFDVSIGGVSPGTGESVRITYIAVHN